MSDLHQGDCRTNGRWTKVEHEKFLLGIELYGKNWKKIEELVGTRTGSQIRSHAQKFFLKTQKTTNDQQQSPQVNENQESNHSATVISKQCSNSEEHEAQHSYFMNKIIKASGCHQDFNFWEQLIDVGSSKAEAQKMSVKRKDSFVAFDTCNDSKQDTAFSYLPIIGESIL